MSLTCFLPEDRKRVPTESIEDVILDLSLPPMCPPTWIPVNLVDKSPVHRLIQFLWKSLFEDIMPSGPKITVRTLSLLYRPLALRGHVTNASFKQWVGILLMPKMNDFPVIGDPCFAHRILGSPGGKHCESLQRNIWRGVVSPLKAVSLDRECRILPWFYEKRM